MEIERLNFSTRTYNCLKRKGINTVEQLKTISDYDLLDIRCFGVGCLAEVRRQIGKPLPTNADRIRAMSDVMEMARMFVRAVADECPPEMDWDCAKDKEGWDACDACWCKWLQQPAEEETDGKE